MGRGGGPPPQETGVVLMDGCGLISAALFEACTRTRRQPSLIVEYAYQQPLAHVAPEGAPAVAPAKAVTPQAKTAQPVASDENRKSGGKGKDKRIISMHIYPLQFVIQNLSHEMNFTSLSDVHSVLGVSRVADTKKAGGRPE